MTRFEKFWFGAAVIAAAVIAAGCRLPQNAAAEKTCIVLVGHGIPAGDYPKARLGEFFELTTHKFAQGDHLEGLYEGHPENHPGYHPGHGNDPKLEEIEKDIRQWPRTPQNDPYKFSVETLARDLSRRTGYKVYVAFNEFCSPTLQEAVDRSAADGFERVIVVSTMMIQGGTHSEADIPGSIALAKKQHPDVEIVYAWPYEHNRLAAMMAETIRNVEN